MKTTKKKQIILCITILCFTIISICALIYYFHDDPKWLIATIIALIAVTAPILIYIIPKIFPPPQTDKTESKDKLTPPLETQKNVKGRMPMNILPPRNEKFTGRKKLLDDIHTAFQTKNEVSLVQAQAITGIGGVGKSETATEYVYRYRQEYNQIWWVNAETKANIDEAYFSFAEKNGLSSPEDKTETIIDKIDKVKNWMNDNDKWLFIYDNVEDEKSLEDYRPAVCREGQHILVTSRNTHFLHCKLVKIDIFTETEACKFIKKYTEKPADKYFKILAEQMGYLPLALDQAGAYMKINQKSYEKYLDLYNQKSLTLLSKYPDDPEKKTVATIWLISLEKINNFVAAKQLLNLCAFFAPENILTHFFSDARKVLPDELCEAVADAMNYDETIAELTKYSLVTLNEGALSIHRLVQEVIRDSLKQEEAEWRNICINILNGLCYEDFSTAESRTLFLILVSHILAVTGKISDEDATKETASLYYFLGYGYDELANYGSALEYYNKALAIREKVFGKEHPSTATTYNNMAFVYDEQGDYDRALEYYGKALKIKEKVLGKEHPSTATTYNNMAVVFREQGDYDRALEYYNKALAIREKVLGKEHPDTAATYNNMALVYDEQGDYNRALEYYGKALAILKKVLGKEHPNTKIVYDNMARAYDESGKSEAFEEWLKKN